MKNIKLGKNVKVVAQKNFNGEKKMIDYYLVTESHEKIYAFTRKYANGTYELCKAGIRVNDLLTFRSRDNGVMRLVKYAKVIMPYLAEEYNLKIA